MRNLFRLAAAEQESATDAVAGRVQDPPVATPSPIGHATPVAVWQS